MKTIISNSLLFLFLITGMPDVSDAQDSKQGERMEIPTRIFENFMGTWQAPDTLIAKYPPEMAQKSLVTWEWGSEKRMIRIYEIHAPGKKGESILEGSVLWNPVTHKVEFFAYNKNSDLLFKGEYSILEENRVQRNYNVYYPKDHRLYENGNAVINFRETYTLSDDKKIKYNNVEYYNKKENRWDPWSTSALVRKQ